MRVHRLRPADRQLPPPAPALESRLLAHRQQVAQQVAWTDPAVCVQRGVKYLEIGISGKRMNMMKKGYIDNDSIWIFSPKDIYRSPIIDLFVHHLWSPMGHPWTPGVLGFCCKLS